MRYISTRGGKESLTFADATLTGLARNGGLLVPESYPQLDLGVLRGKSFRDIAFAVIRSYWSEVPDADLWRIINDTFTAAIFGSDEITPLKPLLPGVILLKLSTGPTLAFKDVAMQLLARIIEYLLKKSGGKLNILGATSGDTGSAAEYAFRDKEGINIFMLSPWKGMSRFQSLQMYTLANANVFNLAVSGKFDDGQRVVKQVNAVAEFKERFHIGAVNSINWARIAAQTIYYVYAYLQATANNDQQVDFVVPSGNFGNALSAHVARQMGVPIRYIVVATNENDVLDEFFRTGIYRVRMSKDVKQTTSPSMDITLASNFERLMFDATYREPRAVIKLWDDIAKHGSFVAESIAVRLSKGWKSGVASVTNVRDTIYNVHQGTVDRIIIDPHTAVGVYVGLNYMRKYRSEHVPMIVAETASPVKFADTIREAIGIEPPIPKDYERLDEMTEHVTRIDPDPMIVMKFIAANVQDL